MVSATDTELTQAWDRRPNEPARAYASFRVFRDLPAYQRTMSAVAEKVGVVERTIWRWAKAHDWNERANAWDDACHEIDDGERLDAIRAMHKTHRKAGQAAVGIALRGLASLNPETMPPSVIARLLELGAKLERQTLIVSVEELQGIEIEDESGSDDPWERIARELESADIADE